jgi:hypothetical protein
MHQRFEFLGSTFVHICRIFVILALCFRTELWPIGAFLCAHAKLKFKGIVQVKDFISNIINLERFLQNLKYERREW